MPAVTVPSFGDPDVLAVAERPTREPGPGEVRIAVAAAAVNPTDLGLRSGAASPGANVTDPLVPGMGAAGTIEAVGPDVTRLQVGDRVMAAILPRRPEARAYPSPLIAPAASVVRVPDDATLPQAATLNPDGVDGVLDTALVGPPVFPPERAADAHRRQEEGGVRGRLLIVFADEEAGA